MLQGHNMAGVRPAPGTGGQGEPRTPEAKEVGGLPSVAGRVRKEPEGQQATAPAAHLGQLGAAGPGPCLKHSRQASLGWHRVGAPGWAPKMAGFTEKL